MIKSGDQRAVAIWEEWNKAAMNAFPQLSNMDIDNILAYTDYKPEPVVAATAAVTVNQGQVNGILINDLIFIGLVTILIILLTVIFILRSVLKFNGLIKK